jgi:CubicO group peptidase (beta-lactamase class C family)
MEKQTIPGMAITVLRNGKVLKAEGYGWADVEKKIPVKPTTVFQIQSVTKSFTAAATMLLVDEGKIALEDKLAKYFDPVPAAWSNITVRHLLTHTSGIKDFINEPTADLTKETTPEEIFESLRNRPLNFTPGEKYVYSNTGYQLLGMIIRKITGQPWHEFVRDRILRR